MLRGLTYLQTADGPNAGNVVLWMQPDGTLDPAPSRRSCPTRPTAARRTGWLGRSGRWARATRPSAARTRPSRRSSGPARARVGAVNRECLVRYGQYLDIDGQRAPAWLISDGADASAEAVLGLAAYVQAGGVHRADRVGAAERRRGRPRGGRRPDVALRRRPALGAVALGVARLGVTDAGGPGRCLQRARRPAPGTRRGHRLVHVRPVDAHLRWPGQRPPADPQRPVADRLRRGLAPRVAPRLGGRHTGRPAHRLAGIVASWYFGANPAGAAMYDPASGATYDGISGDGTVNHNSGAESTIHGLLAMIALDQHPDVAALARTATIGERVGTTTVEAERATLSGGAHAVAPSSLWTGEALYSAVGLRSRPRRRRRVLHPERQPALAGAARRRPAAREHGRHDVHRRWSDAGAGAVRWHRRAGRLPGARCVAPGDAAPDDPGRDHAAVRVHDRDPAGTRPGSTP